MEETRRQAIDRVLRQGPMTVLDISRKIGAPIKTVLADLEHVIRSLRGRGRLVVKDAECISCGFPFKGRKRVETPSRCPRCRSENIRDPEFAIHSDSPEPPPAP
jgi:hypothetical protein